MDSRHRDGPGPKDTDEPAPPGIPESEYKMPVANKKPLPPAKPVVSTKGIENAKKRLRAFSIQKRVPLTASPAMKPSSSGTSAVLIGRLNSIKPSRFAPIEDDVKKPPKPPKPGSRSKNLQDSYVELQRKTLSEIEDMKRKMELVDLGIPLGLICPGIVDDRAMPTKAMPPIKSLLEPEKVDQIIREAKKAKEEGKEFKFDYRKLLPDYDNPFQRKKDDSVSEEAKQNQSDRHKSNDWDKRRDSYRHDSKKDDRRGGRSKDKSQDKSRDRDSKKAAEADKTIEASVNLKDYLVCDSWSLDEKTNSSSPNVDDKHPDVNVSKEGTDTKGKERVKPKLVDSPLAAKPKNLNSPLLAKPRNSPISGKSKNSLMVPTKLRLQPVIDSFKFEIDEPNEDDVLDLYEDIEDIPLPPSKSYDDPVNMKIFDDVDDTSNCVSMDDDMFLESVINEIKGENIDEDYGNNEKSLVEYEMSPVKDEDLKDSPDGSVTPELDDSMRELQSSRHSSYSDGYRSTESGFKSTESGYKSTESGYKSTESGYKSSNSDSKTRDKTEYKKEHEKSSKSDSKRDKSADRKSKHKSSSPDEYKSTKSADNYRMSIEKEDDSSSMKMSKYTMESLETWSFVLKFCQPLLFRHDKAKCYKETQTTPKLWYAEAPKHCACVDDRSVIYTELQECKMALVDRVYGCDQISDAPFPTVRPWYPRGHACLSETTTVPIASDWEADDLLVNEVIDKAKAKEKELSITDKRDTIEGKLVKRDQNKPKSTTPLLTDHLELDREYHKFMEAVWPNVGEKLPGTPPELLQGRGAGAGGAGAGAGRAGGGLCSDGWSQESELDEEPPAKKQKVDKKEKSRKRKHSVSTLSDSNSEENSKKKKTDSKKKEKKKLKAKLAKRRRTEKKRLKKLKEKQKKKKAQESPDEEEIEIKKEHKKPKKKKQLKLKKKDRKKKKTKKKSSSSESSDSSSPESSSDTESSLEKTKKSKKELKRKKKDKKRKESTSETTQSDTELFDANILNNIKKELTDEEKISKKIPREIINVKELQNDFADYNIIVKQEVVDDDASKNTIEDEKPTDTNEEIQPEPITNIIDIPLPQKIPVLDENLSQSSSQASQETISDKNYEKDESHLRPSSQNSNYSFNDVMASKSGLYNKGLESETEGENYEPQNYEVYEQMALAYQNDVANQPCTGTSPGVEQKIETVVRRRGEIKCDWRPPERGAGNAGAGNDGEPKRPSRWGLKPGDVNIVLTGGEQNFKQAPPVYQIESLANRNTDNSMSYDEAYMDTYGASDRLQYGDCFAEPSDDVIQTSDDVIQTSNDVIRSSLDDRIDKALRNSVLGEVARDPDDDKENKDRNKNKQSRAKSVSFADGYKPGQDSDVEDPPKKKKRRRVGCAWPCPSSHPDHVPLWDALPPPPPPDEPYPLPRPAPPPPARLPLPPLNQISMMPHHASIKFDPSSIPGFMPPEPPPGLITFN